MMDGVWTSPSQLKDFKLAVEFKHLMKHAPGGVYLLPELDNIHTLHGVIFIRKGLYREGIFRFTMILPENYNDTNTHPQIFFKIPVFNPLVHPETGHLDLAQDESMKMWDPDKFFIQNALTFLKKIFYMKTYAQFPTVANEYARQMYDTNREGFLEMVEDSVKQSLKSVYDKQGPTCTLIFTEQSGAHRIVRDTILGVRQEDGDENDSSEAGAYGHSAKEGLEHRVAADQREEHVESFYNPRYR